MVKLDPGHKAIDFINRMLSNEFVKQGVPLSFLIDTRRFAKGAPPDVREYLSSLYSKAVELQCLEATIDTLPDAERDLNQMRQRGIKSWFAEQLKLIESGEIPGLKPKAAKSSPRWGF